jgi:hypothetical protein
LSDTGGIIGGKLGALVTLANPIPRGGSMF